MTMSPRDTRRSESCLARGCHGDLRTPTCRIPEMDLYGMTLSTDLFEIDLWHFRNWTRGRNLHCSSRLRTQHKQIKEKHRLRKWSQRSFVFELSFYRKYPLRMRGSNPRQSSLHLQTLHCSENIRNLRQLIQLYVW